MTNYAPEVILECSLNARDLGGIPAAEGLRVQSGRLIRSGELSRLSPNDERYLRSIGLHTVIDLRTDNERELKSDRQIDGVLYMHLPVIEGLLPGITRESIEDPYKAFSRPDYAEKLGSNGFAVMRSASEMTASLAPLKSFAVPSGFSPMTAETQRMTAIISKVRSRTLRE